MKKTTIEIRKGVCISEMAASASFILSAIKKGLRALSENCAPAFQDVTLDRVSISLY